MGEFSITHAVWEFSVARIQYNAVRGEFSICITHTISKRSTGILWYFGAIVLVALKMFCLELERQGDSSY